MKKLVSVLTAALLIAIPSTAVFAHGHGHSGAAKTRYYVCSVQNCAQTGLHNHNNKTYAAHYYNDGHSYHVGGYHH